jgi:poly [ADP-ribose] polymerase 7/11/12/13
MSNQRRLKIFAFEVVHLRPFRLVLIVWQIYRIQNPFLKKAFDKRKDELTKLYESHKVIVEEKLLFHGTSTSVVKNICEQNFDWRRNGESMGTAFGQGAYFAENSAYSDSFASQASGGTTHMFLAKVLVGLMCTGKSSMKYPPEWIGTIQYDTTVDDPAKPTIYVKYDSNDYYPAYLIQYTS